MVKVVGAGPGRTGTDSLREALQVLGFGPCYHMFVARAENHADLWLDAEEAVRTGKEFDFGRIFAPENGTHYPSTVDYPSTTFFPEIFKQNPDAKVVLSLRDSPEAWADSVMATIGSKKLADGLKTAGEEDPEKAAQHKMAMATVFDHPRAFNGKGDDRDYLIRYYNKWQEEVKALVPEGQLLVFNVKEGWEPLCRFLEVEVPQEPFPNRNSRKDWKEKFNVDKE